MRLSRKIWISVLIAAVIAAAGYYLLLYIRDALFHAFDSYEYVLVAEPQRFPSSGELIIIPPSPLYRRQDRLEIELQLTSVSGAQFDFADGENIKLTNGKSVSITLLCIAQNGTRYQTKPFSWEGDRIIFKINPFLPKETGINKLIIQSNDFKELRKLTWWDTFAK